MRMRTREQTPTYLKKEAALTRRYKDMHIDFGILIACHDFKKWLKGCVDDKKCKFLNTPLMWRFTQTDMVDSAGQPLHVKCQYKYTISDTGSAQKEEWGPWDDKAESWVDPATGEVSTRIVQVSRPEGLRLMLMWPDTNVNPGLEEWMDDKDWSRKKIFHDISRYTFQVPKIGAAGGPQPSGHPPPPPHTHTHTHFPRSPSHTLHTQPCVCLQTQRRRRAGGKTSGCGIGATKQSTRSTPHRVLPSQ